MARPSGPSKNPSKEEGLMLLSEGTLEARVAAITGGVEANAGTF
jgi:hypothetical protein